MPMPVLMELHQIIVRDHITEQFVVLKEVHGERELRMVIDKNQADAINRRLEGRVHPRPMTHDLLASVIERLGGKLDRIEITNLHNATFFAQLSIQQAGKEIDIDSRPSDAIALGIANAVPIYVAEHVLDEVAG
jgi:bifunctional DNase/RNase